MGVFDYFTGRKKPKGNLTFGSRQSRLFLERVGIVNSYDDNLRSYIEKGYQQNPVVYSIVNNIAKNVAKAKWKCVNSKGEQIQVPLLSKLMFQPNALQKWKDLNEALTTHYLLEGNAFLTGEYGSGMNSGKYNTIYILPTEETQVIANNPKAITGFRVNHSFTADTEIPAADMMWLRTPNPDYDESDNWLFGQSPFKPALSSIQIYNDARESLLWFQQNKGSQKILMNKNEEIELPPEALDQLKSKLRSQAQGTNNTGNIPIIDAELASLDVSANLDALMLFEQLNQSAQEICNVLNFPSQLIGLKDSTYQNAKEAKKGLWENCVIPMLEELKEGFNTWLTPQFGDVWLDYDVSHIDALQEDKIMRFKAIKEGAGMISINEARLMAGLEPVDELGEFKGDDMYVGFVQAVVSDSEELSDQNGESEQDNNDKEEKQ